MLHTLLGILKEGKTVSIDEIAEKLDTTKEIAAALIEYLEKSNYIKKVNYKINSGCGHNCSKCGQRGSVSSSLRMWELAK